MNQSLINSIFRAMIQSQIYHWLTPSPHIHSVLGDYYEGMQDLIDELVENSIANGLELYGNAPIDINYEYNESAIFQCLINCKENVEQIFYAEENETVKDALLAILKLVDKTIYLLGMNDD